MAPSFIIFLPGVLINAKNTNKQSFRSISGHSFESGGFLYAVSDYHFQNSFRTEV